MSDALGDRRRLLLLVMLAVWAWGTLLAIGAWLYGFDRQTGDVRFSPNLWRGLIVESFVLGFLGLWWMLVWRRR